MVNTIFKLFKYYIDTNYLFQLILGLMFFIGTIIIIAVAIIEFKQGKWQIVIINVGAAIGCIALGIFISLEALTYGVSTEPLYNSVTGTYSVYVGYRKDIKDRSQETTQASKEQIWINGYLVDVSGTLYEYENYETKIKLNGSTDIEGKNIEIQYECFWKCSNSNDILNCSLSIVDQVSSKNTYISYKMPISYRNDLSQLNFDTSYDKEDEKFIHYEINQATKAAGSVFSNIVNTHYSLWLKDEEISYFSAAINKQDRAIGEVREGTIQDYLDSVSSYSNFDNNFGYNKKVCLISDEENCLFTYHEENNHITAAINTFVVGDTFEFSASFPRTNNKDDKFNVKIKYEVGQRNKGFYYENVEYYCKMGFNTKDYKDLIDLEPIGVNFTASKELEDYFYYIIDNCIEIFECNFSQAVFEGHHIKLVGDDISKFAYGSTITPKLEQYTITYHLNGGELENPVSSFDVENVVTFPIPTKEGADNYTYQFDGWYLEESFINKVTSTIDIEKDIDLYAKFNKVYDTYTIIYSNIDGYKYSFTPPTSYQADGSILQLPELIQDGCAFMGYYYTKKDYDSYDDCFMSIDTSIAQNLSLRPVFEIIHKITWDLDGGTYDGELLDGFYSKQPTIDFTSIIPTKPGYLFDFFEVRRSDKKGYCTKCGGTHDATYTPTFGTFDSNVTFTVKAIYKAI